MNISSIGKLLLSLLCVLICTQTSAQPETAAGANRIFSGTVTGGKNVPLADVAVYIQEKRVTATTNRKGEFVINGNIGDILIFKKPGYLSAQRVLAGIDVGPVSLQEAGIDAGDDDDVSIPFGTRKKRQVSAAVTHVNTSRIPQLPVGDLRNLFSGRVSGLYLPQTSTAPGGEVTNVQVRSISSLQANNARIYVDGTEREFGDMDLSEVGSITVLKDAASLAWYGLRGGNGIVLVNTKRGSASHSYLHFDSQVGVQAGTGIIKPLNSYDYARLYNEATLSDGSAAGPYTQAALDAYKNGTSPYLYPSNNYVKDYLRNAALVQRYAFSTGGGKNNVRYFAAVSYFTQAGLLNHTQTSSFNSNAGFKKLNFRGNVDFDVNRSLTVSLNASIRTENRLAPGNGLDNILTTLYNTPPNAFPVYNADGSLGGTSQYTANPAGLLQQSGYSSTLDRVLLATLNIKQKLDSWVPGLSAHVLASYDGIGNYFSGITQQYTVSDFSLATPGKYLTASPVAYRATSYGNNFLQNEFWVGLDYDKSFGLHTLNASVRAQRYANKAPERLDYRNQGLAGRIDYSFRQRYFLGFTAGYSGSENFAPGKRYGFFPAVSAGWVASEENFLKGSSVFDYVKLRASYGTAGNGDIGGSRFPFESFYSRNLTGGGYSFGTTPAASNSAAELNLGNPLITWETIQIANAGFDTRFLHNSLGFSADLYHTRRTSILTANVFPSLLGQDAGLVNGGTVESRGVEMSGFYTRRWGKFSIAVNGNLLLSKSKVIAENGQIGLPAYQQTIGRIARSTLVFVSDGLFRTQAEIDRNPKQTLSGKLVPGDIKYRDVGGPSGVPDGIIDNNDRIRIDKSDIPDTYYGFGATIAYGVVDLAVQFQGVAGRTVNIQNIVNSGPASLNQESLNRWTPATSATALYPRLGIADRGNNTAASDFWLRSGDYLRLKSVEAGVNLPVELIRRYKISGARLFVGGFNLLSTNKLGLDADPEVLSAGRGTTYPYIRTYTLGVSATF